MAVLQIFFLCTLLIPSFVLSKLEVIGTGFPRTGTDSMKEALNILGYRTYHMKEIVENRLTEDLKIWYYLMEHDCEASDAEELLEKVFGKSNYTATVGINFPCSEKLMHLYPNAKIVHTQRSDANLWHDSVMNSMCAMFPSLLMRAAAFVSPFFRQLRSLGSMFFTRAITGEAEGTLEINRDACQEKKEQMMAAYNAHNEKIQAIVPPERLLVITNHKGGWKPLCDFLGKPIPEVPYPRANAREEFQKMLKGHLAKALSVIIPILSGVVAVVLFVQRTMKNKATKKGARAKTD